MEEPRSEAAVVVSAWGPAFGYPHTPVFDGEQFADQGPGIPYDKRAKVSNLVDPSTSLGSIIDLAAAKFGVLSRDDRSISEQVPCVAFFRVGDEDGMGGGWDRWISVIRTVEHDCSPSWALRWSEIQLDELLSTSAAGLLKGDPLRPYFWPVIPQGEFTDVAAALWTMWTLWEHYLAARETTGIARRVLERVRRAEAASQRDRKAWEQWLRRPHILVPYLDSAPRTTAQIASDTGISEPQVEGALWGMGYVLGQDGRWRPGDDATAKVLRNGLLDIKHRGHGPREMSEVVDSIDSLLADAETSNTDTESR